MNPDYELILGDAIEALNIFPDAHFDLICADMPYGTTRCKWDNPVDLPLLWKQYKRVAKPRCAIILFAQTPFDKVLGCSNLPWLRYEIIWHKAQATGHFNAKKMPMKAHENILVFYDKLPTFNPIKTEGHTIKRAATGKVHKSKIYGREYEKPDYCSTSRYPRSVQFFPSDRQHSNLWPTQKPLALLEWIVESYSNRGDIVLDNFCGSGTTGHACIRLHRKFTGIDSDQGAITTASSRLSSATQENRVD